MLRRFVDAIFARDVEQLDILRMKTKAQKDDRLGLRHRYAHSSAMVRAFREGLDPRGNCIEVNPVRPEGQIIILALKDRAERSIGMDETNVRHEIARCRRAQPEIDLGGDALDAATADADVGSIVFAARGRHFSAGADFTFLTELRTMPAAAVKDPIYAVFQGAARRIYHCPKPVVAAVQGAAITVACELALACDYRIIAPSAMFQEAWIKLGLLPPLGGLFLLPRIVGLGRASDILLSGRPVLADEAVRIGLASECVEAEEALWARVQQLAEQMAALPPLGFRAAKEALHHGLGSTMEREWAANSGAQSILIGTDDFEEGLDAQRTRRAANFAGR